MAAEFTTFPLTRPINLLVRLGRGSVTVAAREGLAEATVRLTPRDGSTDVLRRFVVELTDTTLIVAGSRRGGVSEIVGGWRGGDAVDVEIQVPAGTPMKMATAEAHVSVTGECGDANITTGAAGISVDRVAGNLRLRYGHAECRVGTVSGTLQVRGGKGDAHVGRVDGRLECGFGSGELTVDVAGGEVRARAGSGSARIGAAYGNVDLAWGAGPITIGLPAGVAARVDVTSGSGQTHSDLPVEPVAPADGSEPITVRARTGSGEIHLLRAAVAA